jgi:uncharacterized protein
VVFKTTALSRSAIAPELLSSDEPMFGILAQVEAMVNPARARNPHHSIMNRRTKPQAMGKMDPTTLILGILAFVYIGVTIYLANQQDLKKRVSYVTTPSAVQTTDDYLHTEEVRRGETIVRWLLYGIVGIIFLFALLILQTATLSNLQGEFQNLQLAMPEIDQTAAAVNFVLAIFAVFISVRVVASQGMRQFIKRLVGERNLYNPNSWVHQAAIVLCLMMLSITIGQLVLIGGTSGLAQEVETNGLTPGSVVFDMVLRIIVSFLGVGLAIRRSPGEALQRLGLRAPTLGDVTWGMGFGVLLLGVVFIVGAVWEALASPETIQEQTAAAEQIARAFGTLPLAFLLSISAALGEEIMFRGALQPVFGLFTTSIFFAILHTQYSLTPATLIIIVVAFVLGWLRNRQSTTSAIIAHFVYNFLQLSLAILFSEFFSV